jgi:multiple inositol-polyphosphate phosphatase/2,3-bisphosphoglycerate 3-phosphatase
MRQFFALITLFIFCYQFINAQTCEENFWGTKQVYFPQQKNYTPPPKGYEPIFINYIGRHGARHLTKPMSENKAYQLVMKAANKNALTEVGASLKNAILNLSAIEANADGNISELGKLEQSNIAKRMVKNNPHVFGKKVLLVNTTVGNKIRTLQSANAFLEGLKEACNCKIINRQYIDDTTTRFYDLSPAYENYKKIGNWQHSLDTLETHLALFEKANDLIEKVFTAEFAQTIKRQDALKFMQEVFGFLTIIPSLKNEIISKGISVSEVNFFPFFNCKVLQALHNYDNAEAYFLKGPGNNVNGIQVKIAAPLLADFIYTTDSFIANKKTPLQIRFGHAETIAPFAAFMGISGASTQIENVSQISTFWEDSKIIPLSANIQWVLYYHPKLKHYLVKFLLNEKEVSINGLTTQHFPFYDWQDVKKYYSEKLIRFNIYPNTDLYQWLFSLQ